MNRKIKEYFAIEESDSVINATKRIKKILDAKYKKVYSKLLVKQLDHLDKHDQLLLLCLLHKYEKTKFEKVHNYIMRNHSLFFEYTKEP